MIGEGTQTLNWGRAVIRRLADQIKAGTKFFVNHGKDNSHDGRQAVGEVVASYARDIGGKLSDIVIGHFPDADHVKPMDVCSIEADVHIVEDNVGDVNDVTGIALGVSEHDSPAFPGAQRMAAVQCFDEDTQPKSGEEEGTMAVTFAQVKEFVQERNVYAHQLFTEKDIQNDREFSHLFDENTQLTEENNTLKQQVEEKDTAIKKAEAQSKITGAKDRFTTLLPDNLTEKQKAFINTRFKPEVIADMSDDEVNAYIEEERKQFAETAKLFGVTEESPTGTESGDEPGTEDDGDSSSPEDAALKLIGVE